MSENEWKGFTFNVSEEQTQWLQGCYVEKTFRPEGLLTLQNKLQMEGVFSVGTTPMGGKLVLLTPKEGAIESILGDGSIALEKWFHSLHPWKSEMVAKERSVWLNITGVPLQGWTKDFFRSIVSYVGNFINLDESMRRKTRLDVGRVFTTITSPEAINRVVKVKINDKVFAIRMVEDVFRHSAFHLNIDCVIPTGEHSSSEDSDSVIDSNLTCSEWEEESEGGSPGPASGAPLFSNSKNSRVSEELEGGIGSPSRVADSLVSSNKTYNMSRWHGGFDSTDRARSQKEKGRWEKHLQQMGYPILIQMLN